MANLFKFSHLLNDYFQGLVAHLDLIEGVVVDLLQTKWKSFIRRTFFRQIMMFTCYFLLSSYAFVKRPNGLGPHCVPIANDTNTTALMDPLFVTMAMGNETFLPLQGDYFKIERQLNNACAKKKCALKKRALKNVR